MLEKSKLVTISRTRNRIFKLEIRFQFLYFCIIKCNNFHADKLTFSPRLRFKRAVLRTNKYANAQQTRYKHMRRITHCKIVISVK